VDKSSFPGTTGSYPRHPQDCEQSRSAHGEIFFHRAVFFVDKLKCKIYELLLFAHLRQAIYFLTAKELKPCSRQVTTETDDVCQDTDRLYKGGKPMIELPTSQEHKATFESHFGFRETPFGVTPDPRFFYSHPLYLEGLAALVHGIETKKGCMLVTGDMGTGKTILVRKLMCLLDARVHFVFVSNTHLTSYGLTELMVESLGLSNKEKSRLEMIQDLNDYLTEQLKTGRTVVLVIDEAQKLNDEALEGLCELSNLETDREKLLQIVLVGQPELVTKLNKSSLRRIKQRIAIHHRLHSLQTTSEIDQYIRHRLEIAGYDGPEIFTKEAVEAIWHYSEGTPRSINILCDTALAIVCAANRKKVSPYMLMRAAGDLLLQQVSEATKIGAAEPGLLKTKTPAPRINRKRSEINGVNASESDGPEAVIIRLRPSDPVWLSRAATKEPAVSVQFFERMTHAATEAMGPMADRILGDQISALGESRDAFPQGKLAELILRVSGKILNETMRARFQTKMIHEIAALKAVGAFYLSGPHFPAGR
jgi:general secretion pathway protein A